MKVNGNHFSGYLRTEPIKPDPVAEAIEQYLLMERKARAWDQLDAILQRYRGDVIQVDLVLELVHPAQKPPA